MPCIKAKDPEAATEEAFEVDQDHQEVVVVATTEVTEVASDETKNLINTQSQKGTQTILKTNPKINKQQPLTKGATTTTKIMTGEDQTLPDPDRAEQENGVLIVAKLHTIQLNVGATKRKR